MGKRLSRPEVVCTQKLFQLVQNSVRGKRVHLVLCVRARPMAAVLGDDLVRCHDCVGLAQVAPFAGSWCS
jgi:hypothetical protein